MNTQLINFCEKMKATTKGTNSKEPKKAGGTRPGAGRKKQFKNPATINFKCELSDKEAAKEKYGLSLNKKFNEWLKAIIK